jgi:hypothetical protein
LIIERAEIPTKKEMGIKMGFWASKFFFLAKKIKIQAIKVMMANIWLALTVTPAISKEPIRSNGKRKATKNIPKIGLLKIAKAKAMKITMAKVISGASLRKKIAKKAAAAAEIRMIIDFDKFFILNLDF